MILVFPNPILKQLFMNQIGVPVHALLRKLSLTIAPCDLHTLTSLAHQLSEKSNTIHAQIGLLLKR